MPFKKEVFVIANVALAVLAISLAASTLAAYHWYLDLFSHFQIQYAVGALLLALFFISFRKWKQGVLCLVLLLTSLANIVTAYDYSAPSIVEGEPFKVIHYNRKYTLPDTEIFRAFMARSQADVIVIEEARIAHVEAAQSIKELYPYQIHEPRENAFGIAVLSKHPFTQKSVRDFKRIALNNIQARFTVAPTEGKSVTIYAIHPPPPTNSLLHAQRSMELTLTAADIKADTSERIIMLGDWNITPFSPHFKKLILNTELKNEFSTPWLFSTWPSPFMIPFLQIPIDHILHKGKIELVEKKRGPAMGSDHYPVIARFALTD